MDEEKIKLLEGVIGEEESISRDTMKNIENGSNKKVDVIAFCCGTAENLTNNKINTGILRRMSPIIIFLSPEEHSDIIKFINLGVGEMKSNRDSEPITKFYEEIADIQEGYNKEIRPITGYIISEEIKEEVNNFFLPLTVNLHKKYRMSLATESEGTWRFICCSAMLRVFEKHRKGLIRDNKLIIDHQDLEIGKKLIQREISTKSIILQCIDTVDQFNIKTREQLIDWERKRQRAGLKELPKEAKFIMNSNLK